MAIYPVYAAIHLFSNWGLVYYVPYVCVYLCVSEVLPSYTNINSSSIFSLALIDLIQ